MQLKAGDTLMAALMREGADRQDAYDAIDALRGEIDVRRLRAGTAGRLHFRNGQLDDLVLRLEPDRELVSHRRSDGFASAWRALPTTAVTGFAAGPISSSLYLAADAQGVPAHVILQLIRMFSYDVDFQRDIWPGDRFELIWERAVVQADGTIRDGAIAAARLSLRDKHFEIFRFIDPDTGEPAYFHRDGRSVRKSLLKTPIDGARLTSHFGPRRHPVLGYTRMHKGLDFGAPTGTPIYAAGDGVVERASRYGSYGHYVRIRHNSEYKTAYAHLSRYGAGIKAGARVRQGQIIGYVGATGRVTGAHLHYEVLKNGAQVNPRSLDLPAGTQLSGQALAALQALAAQHQDDLAALDRLQSLRRASREDS
ncbi:MAG: M23 family metallopeptidase [Rhodothalassiaceae bacterium]